VFFADISFSYRMVFITSLYKVKYRSAAILDSTSEWIEWCSMFQTQKRKLITSVVLAMLLLLLLLLFFFKTSIHHFFLLHFGTLGFRKHAAWM